MQRMRVFETNDTSSEFEEKRPEAETSGGSCNYQWCYRAEYTYRNNEVDTHSLNGGAPLAGAKGEISSNSFMVNGIAYLEDRQR